MAGTYTVKQGDHLSKIAKEFGFSDYHTIWDHPNNAALKQQRSNPSVLYPGDSLFIPDRQQRLESRNTDKLHQFQAKKPALKLRLALEDAYEKPIANAPCILAIGSDSRNVTTDGSGKIEQDIPPDVHDAILVVQDEQTPLNNTQIEIKIGDLDPVEEISGQIARLDNLGYFAGDVNQPDQKAFESAVEEFQCDQGLTVDGICGPVTQAKLKQVQGC
ncbi:MAG TPA: peptidoglycan-binding protein [Bryobacteraceae bacterium]|nr:peptidoglycan-binding protein [Bryobacteraceae bacterium]